MKLFFESITLILATLTVFVIIATPLFAFIPAFIILILILASIYGVFRKKRRRGQEIFPGTNKEIFTILVFILMIIFLTGGISSPIFFLAYFLLFGITFIFEPLTIFLFLLCVLVLFGPQVLQDDVFGNIFKIGSFAILVPVAYFFGREYKKRERQNQNKAENTKNKHDKG